jgi:hypothetical protein
MTAEDHFFAHLLLAKAHGGKMWYALVAMTIGSNGRNLCNGFLRRSRRVVSRAREEAAGVHSTAMKGRFAGDKHPMYGKPCSELAKERTRERHAAGLGPMSRPEARDKVSKKLKGRVFSEETRAKISATKTGQPRSEASRKKQSATMTGRKLSDQHKENVRLANTGKKRSPEHLQRMREINLGKTLSEETKAKIRKRWAEQGHPRGMLGKKQSPEFKGMMRRLAAARKQYAAVHSVPIRKITKAMLIEAGMWQ